MAPDRRGGVIAANDNTATGVQPDPLIRALISFAAGVFEDLAPWEIDDLERAIMAERKD